MRRRRSYRRKRQANPRSRADGCYGLHQVRLMHRGSRMIWDGRRHVGFWSKRSRRYEWYEKEAGSNWWFPVASSRTVEEYAPRPVRFNRSLRRRKANPMSEFHRRVLRTCPLGVLPPSASALLRAYRQGEQPSYKGAHLAYADALWLEYHMKQDVKNRQYTPRQRQMLGGAVRALEPIVEALYWLKVEKAPPGMYAPGR